MCVRKYLFINQEAMLQVVFVRYLSDMFPSHSLYVPLSLSLLLALTTFYYPCVCAHLSCV